MTHVGLGEPATFFDHVYSGCTESVITVNGEVQTHEEATVYVKELGIFLTTVNVRELDMLLTVNILLDTPAVFPFGKLCEDPGYSYEWANSRKPCLI